MKKIGFFLITFVFSWCTPPKRELPKLAVLKPGKMFVLNEGGFTYNNASLDVFDPASDSIFNNQFEAKNSKKIGDVAQSLSFIDNKLWIVVNNSGKIWVCDTNLMILHEIPSLNSPRFACKVRESKVYVTDIYANEIHIINSSTFQKTGSIKLKGWTEELVAINDSLVIVTNTRSEYVYFINSKTDAIKDSLKLRIGSSSLAVDKNNHVWVGCIGDEKSNFCMYEVDAIEKKIIKQWELSNAISFSPRLCFNAGKDTLFWIENGVRKNSIASESYPNDKLYSMPNSNIYGLGLDSFRNELYVLDAKDFNQSGEMIRMKTNGNFISKHTTGIIPNGILQYF